MKTSFINALLEQDHAAILSAEKSDLHNHAGRGGLPLWLEKRLSVTFSSPPSRFESLSHMQEWFDEKIKPHCPGAAGNMLRWEACFAEAKRNNIKRLVLIFSTSDVDLAGGMEAFIAILHGYKEKYCPDTIFEPELAYFSRCNPIEESQKMTDYLDYDFFKSIDINSGENIQPIKAFTAIYRQAERYGLKKRMHVGETGSASDILVAIDVLGIDEIHHGIAAASSKVTMRCLADRNIRLNVCPSSNIMLGLAVDYASHPIKTLVENGVPVTINTDDLLIFNQPLDKEYIRLFQAGTLSAEELNTIRLRGLDAF